MRTLSGILARIGLGAGVLMAAACSGALSPPAAERIPPPAARAPLERNAVADLERLPQQVRAFAQKSGGDAPLVDAERQAQLARHLRTLHFRPWEMKASGMSRDAFARAMQAYDKMTFYGQNLLPVPDGERRRLTAATRPEAFPSRADHGIVTRETSMRLLPSRKPFYHAPWRPGEGYPFDLLQHGVVRTGTPLFISHASADGTWLFCETAWGSGWLEAEAVGVTGPDLEAAWRAAPAGVIVREGESAWLPQENGAVTVHLGTLVPLDPEGVDVILLPLRDENGRAVAGRARVAAGAAASYPVPFSAERLASLADELVGAPYDWGGAYGDRDCSLLTRELFQAVGCYLPVNSRHQLTRGETHSLAGMSGEEKRAFILEKGVPFRTLVGLPGHVALYVGEWEGEPALLHSLWGLRTREGEEEGRLLVGRVAVTSLNPGLEWPQVRQGETLLSRLSSMTILPGE